jgi:hypothetical protein
MHLILFLALLAPHTPQQYHARAVRMRVQAYRMAVNECQHRSWKHGFRHPGWCKVVK